MQLQFLGKKSENTIMIGFLLKELTYFFLEKWILLVKFLEDFCRYSLRVSTEFLHWLSGSIFFFFLEFYEGSPEQLEK